MHLSHPCARQVYATAAHNALSMFATGSGLVEVWRTEERVVAVLSWVLGGLLVAAITASYVARLSDHSRATSRARVVAPRVAEATGEEDGAQAGAGSRDTRSP